MSDTSSPMAARCAKSRAFKKVPSYPDAPQTWRDARRKDPASPCPLRTVDEAIKALWVRQANERPLARFGQRVRAAVSLLATAVTCARNERVTVPEMTRGRN